MAESDRDDRGRFVPGNGQSFAKNRDRINFNGRPPGRSLVDRLHAMLDDGPDGERLADALIKTALDRALKGDFRFWREILERIDGKVPQGLTDADGSSLTFVLTEAVKKQDATRNGTNGTNGTR